MQMKRVKQTRKEAWLLVGIAFIVLFIFIIWGFQLSVMFSGKDIDLTNGWEETQDQINESVKYAENIEGQVDGRSETIDEYFDEIKDVLEDELVQQDLHELASLILAGAIQNEIEDNDGEELENDEKTEKELPEPNEDGWIIVDEIIIE